MVVYFSHFTPCCAHCATCSDRPRHLTLVPTTAQGLGMRAVRRSAYAFYVPYWVFFSSLLFRLPFGCLGFTNYSHCILFVLLGGLCVYLCVCFGRAIKTLNLLLGKSLNFICQQRQKHCRRGA